MALFVIVNISRKLAVKSLIMADWLGVAENPGLDFDLR
jgi:hypothetical protein